MALHSPRFDLPVDLDAHLRRLPPGASCRGLFFTAAIAQLRRASPFHPLLSGGTLASRRYVAFQEYPYGDFLRLLAEIAPAVAPGLPVGEGLRRLGRNGYDALLDSQIGRVVFGIFGRDFEQVARMGARGYEVSLNFGRMTVEHAGPRRMRYLVDDRPIFLETYQVGIIEGAMRACNVKGQVLIELENVARAKIEFFWE